jgi:hypothetical protein
MKYKAVVIMIIMFRIIKTLDLFAIEFVVPPDVVVPLVVEVLDVLTGAFEQVPFSNKV